MIALGSEAESIRRIQDAAAKEMQKAGYGYTLHNACAATLSEFLNAAGIDVPITLGAGRLARRIADRGWRRVRVGNQRAGDVGVTFDNTSPSGADHIYLVVQVLDPDKMMIGDNQAPRPHVRYASGRGRTPTEYFLRAPEEDRSFLMADLVAAETGAGLASEDFFPWDDEDSNELRELYLDDGSAAELGEPAESEDMIAAIAARLEESVVRRLLNRIAER